jgi:hypothetical protein
MPVLLVYIVNSCTLLSAVFIISYAFCSWCWGNNLKGGIRGSDAKVWTGLLGNGEVESRYELLLYRVMTVVYDFQSVLIFKIFHPVLYK